MTDLENLRAALLEAGLDPALTFDGTWEVDGVAFFAPGIVPLEIAWKAREILGLSRPYCLACFRNRVQGMSPNDQLETLSRCRAGRRNVLDCGRQR